MYVKKFELISVSTDAAKYGRRYEKKCFKELALRTLSLSQCQTLFLIIFQVNQQPLCRIKKLNQYIFDSNENFKVDTKIDGLLRRLYLHCFKQKYRK